MKLVSVIYLVCQEQIEERKLSSKQFAKQLPSPPDPMLDAVREAIIGFFPSGRDSHVREVLTKYDEMNAKTEELEIAKMTQLLNDPGVSKRMNGKIDAELAKALEKMFPTDSEPGT